MGVHLGHAHTHDILSLHMQIDLPRGHSKNLLDHEVALQRLGHDKILQMTNQSGFDLLAKLIVLTDRLNEAPHQLIPLILEQFMPTDSRFETGF